MYHFLIFTPPLSHLKISIIIIIVVTKLATPDIKIAFNIGCSSVKSAIL